MNISLNSIHLKNFRGYIDTVIDFDEHINVIIGKNDVGKSTVLEALEIFFNNEQVKIELEDRNLRCTQDEKIEIACCFSLDEDAKTVVDANVPVRMDQEYLLNEKGKLEILKVWDCSKKTIGAKDVKTFIRANYPKVFDKPLICEKISELKKILKDCVSVEEYETVDKTVASEIRKAIYAQMVSENTEFCLTNIDTAQEGAKNIWTSLQQSLPLFFLFKSDRLNSDKDTEVQSPMKAVTKTVISEMQESIASIVSTVTKQVAEIAKSLTPKVSVKPFDSVFSFELLSDEGVPLSKRGSGVRRLILLSYFRAEAEKKVSTGHNNSIIYAIEEPETAQHPDYQRMVMETLQQLSCDNLHQIIITTHTPEIAKMVELHQLIFLFKDEMGTPLAETREEIKYQSIVSTLGILPFAAEQCVICVEGENDVNFLMNINKIPEFNEIIDLESERIRIIPLHGSNLVRWVNENYFSESNIKEIHFYDNDRQDYRNIANEIKDANDKRRYAWITQRREMENYIPPTIIERVFEIDLGRYYETWSDLDIPKILISKICLNIKNERDREVVIKSRLNGSISKQITAESLKDIDAFEEIETFFKKVKAIIDGKKVKK